MDGIAFHDFWAQDDVILAPYIRREGRVERLVPRFREVAGRLIHMIEQVTPAGGASATCRRTASHREAALLAYGTRWGAPGFLHPDRASRDGLLPCDDWYAAAMLLYSSVAPATPPTTRCSRRTRSAWPTAPAGRP
ncbi:hypothetical protein ACFVRB_20920 [Streptomyces nojiriensis]|uniref:hypothetical protein n=1 Tax=Streptomyces nojiriensis TaxID=66374 RepID=UPI0036D80A4E